MAISGPTTEIEIISLAFVLNGKEPVSSMDEAGAAGRAAKPLYDAIVSAILSYPHFRFNVKTSYIQLLANVHPTFDQWKFAFQLPADYLSMVRTWPNRNYTVFGDQLYTSSRSRWQIEYRYQVPVSKWSPAMRLYAAYELAVALGLSVAESEGLYKDLKMELVEKRAMALFVDSQNHPQRNIKNSSWIAVRGLG